MARGWVAALALAVVLVASASAAPAVGKPKEARRLIALSPEHRVWLTENQVLDLIREHKQFIDVTDTPDLEKNPAPPRTLAYPVGPSHQDEVLRYISVADIERFRADLTTFSTFFTRYYTSTTGTESANWLYGVVRDLAANRSDITVEQFIHANFPQRSLIACFAGSEPTLPLVILGAHQDSINSQNPSGGRSPGADDDGTGSMTLVETFRVIIANGFVPRHPLCFEWYAAEEVGLVGSAAIANSRRNNGDEVYAMLQLDMTGYGDYTTTPVKVLADFTDVELTNYIKTLLDEYTAFTRRDHSCGYGCSDHASYNRAGFVSSSVFEPVTNVLIHQTGDDLDLVNWPQAFEFIKFAISYVVETTYGSP